MGYEKAKFKQRGMVERFLISYGVIFLWIKFLKEKEAFLDIVNIADGFVL